MKLVTLVSALLLALTATVVTTASGSKARDNASKPVVVLVHGAFADASGWSKVITLLERDGYAVIAVQNPLTSLADDVATTRRLIEAQKGPVIVVGHSYGGAVITEAAAGNPNVKALVYVAAFAPDGGEPIGALLGKYPTELGTALVPDAAGFVTIDQAKFHAVFCADLPDVEARVMAVTQKPLSGPILGATVDTPAWKTIPAWYLVSQNDHAINPDLERFYAKRMSARVSEVKSSHVSFISHPAVVVSLIEEAAKTTAN